MTHINVTNGISQTSERRAFSVPRWLVYALCGLLCACPMIFEELWPVSWAALIPVLLLEKQDRRSERHKLLQAWLRGLSFFYFYGLVVFCWFAELYPLDFIGIDADGSVAVIAVAWFGLPLLQALVSALIFPVLSILKRFPFCSGPLTFALESACLWTFFEWIQTLTWAGVPWGKLALTQTGFLWGIQCASLLGSYLVCFIMVFVSGLAAGALEQLFFKKNRRFSLVIASVALAVFTLNFVFGAVRVETFNPEKLGKSVKAAAVQGNISSSEKWNSTPVYTIDVFEDLTFEAARQGAKLILWPETALPYVLNSNDILKDYLNGLSNQTGASVLAGTFTENEDGSVSNVICLSENGELSENFYSKRRLVPFGEFVPMQRVVEFLVPPLARLSAVRTTLVPGTDTAVFDTKYGNVGCLICFDSIYDSLALDTARDGAQLICISTNDSWFKDSSALYEHNRHARLRAVESGRYVVRSASTGISSVISPVGKVESFLGPMEKGVVASDVYMIDKPTPYSIVGNAFPVMCAFIAAGMLAAGARIGKWSTTKRGT